MAQEIELKNKLLKAYRSRSYIETLQIKYLKLKEKLFGLDKNTFRDTIEFYRETKGVDLNYNEALEKALNKKAHKDKWFIKVRENEKEIRDFYKEVDIYPFRQPYLWRFRNVAWYIKLIKHINKPKILEYGCGSACLTEKLVKQYPSLAYTVADIPSVTLDFVRWKKEKHNYTYKILEIGLGKEGIPLYERYSLIICIDVLEHTTNPLDIAKAFANSLEFQGVLVVDYLLDPGGENLEVAANERSLVINYLNEKMLPVKRIDENNTNDGIYIKK